VTEGGGVSSSLQLLSQRLEPINEMHNVAHRTVNGLIRVNII
jgi:hypothetical protein